MRKAEHLKDDHVFFLFSKERSRGVIVIY